MKSLTVFTPAYNRAHTIGRTYESLLHQTCKDFEWLVIDDGSTDDTRDLVESWIAEKKIPIRYIYQSNQGMHGAHNTAYRNIVTELNTCIDSDDYMPDYAVEKILSLWKSIDENDRNRLAGIIGLDEDTKGNIIGTRFLENLKETTLEDFYENGGRGDKKMVYRTEIIKNYPEYPIFEGEKYVSLGYKYALIDQDYKLLVINEPLVTVDYQLDGSSYNMYRQYWNNPKGFAFIRTVYMQISKSFKTRFRQAIHYVADSLIAKNRKFITDSPKKMMTIAALPLGLLWYCIIRYKVKTGAQYKVR